MTPERLIAVRKTAGRAGAVFCILIAIVLADSLASRFTYKFNVLYTMPDAWYDLTGVMPEKSEKMSDLVAKSDSPQVSLEFLEVFSGFWLGNTMWRGKVRVAPSAKPGDYTIQVRDYRNPKINPALDFLIKVYPDALTLRKSHGPFLERRFGISAKWAAIGLFPGLAVILLFNFGISTLLERKLAGTGQAEVYMVQKTAEGFQFAFSLGEKQGMKKGDLLDILNPQSRIVGEAQVRTVGKKDAIAASPSSLEFAEIHSVRLKR